MYLYAEVTLTPANLAKVVFGAIFDMRFELPLKKNEEAESMHGARIIKKDRRKYVIKPQDYDDTTDLANTLKFILENKLSKSINYIEE
jgi:hypothetical protein